MIPIEQQVVGAAERPIIFSAESVRAILAGEKCQTRRVVKPQPASGVRRSIFVPSGFEDGHGREIKIPYRVGDRLWVRETFHLMGTRAGYEPMVERDTLYRADHPEPFPDDGKWTSPIYMPRHLSRLTLEITEVRLQCLQEASDLDLLHEGIDFWYVGTDQKRMRRTFFEQAWDQINPQHPYASNPWVFAITFKRIQP